MYTILCQLYLNRDGKFFNKLFLSEKHTYTHINRTSVVGCPYCQGQASKNAMSLLQA